MLEYYQSSSFIKHLFTSKAKPNEDLFSELFENTGEILANINVFES